jgi:hypothetical protein
MNAAQQCEGRVAALLATGNACAQATIFKLLNGEGGAAMDVLRANLALAAEWASNPAARIDRMSAVSRAFQENGCVNEVCCTAQALSDAPPQVWPTLPFWPPDALRRNVQRRRQDIIHSD